MSVSASLARGGAADAPRRYRHVSAHGGAAIEEFVGVTRVLISEWTRAVGGKMALARVLYAPVQAQQAMFFLLLLTVDGEERPPEWVNTCSNLCGVLLLLSRYGWRFCRGGRGGGRGGA